MHPPPSSEAHQKAHEWLDNISGSKGEKYVGSSGPQICLEGLEGGSALGLSTNI